MLTYLRQAAPKYLTKLAAFAQSEDYSFVAQWMSFGMQALHVSLHSYIQGLPGAGKTTFISMVSILRVVLFKQSVVWAAHGQEALDSGIDMITNLLEDALPEVQHLFVRLPVRSI